MQAIDTGPSDEAHPEQPRSYFQDARLVDVAAGQPLAWWPEPKPIEKEAQYSVGQGSGLIIGKIAARPVETTFTADSDVVEYVVVDADGQEFPLGPAAVGKLTDYINALRAEDGLYAESTLRRVAVDRPVVAEVVAVSHGAVVKSLVPPTER